MPVLIPLALNVGFYIEYLIREYGNFKSVKEKIPGILHFGIIGSIAVLAPIVGVFVMGDDVQINWLLYILVGLFSLAIGLTIIHKLRKKKIKKAIYATVVFMLIAMMFLIPLSSQISGVDNSRVKTLKELAVQHSAKIYGLNYIAPELLWSYGTKIPTLQSNGGLLKKPGDERFLLLTNSEEASRMKIFEKDYSVELLDTIDQNATSAGSKKYRERLVNLVFLMKSR